MTKLDTATRQSLIDDFRNRSAGHMPQEKIEATVAKLGSNLASVPASGIISGVVFYAHISVTSGLETFRGNGGGLCGIGSGSYQGDIYTDDFGALVANTSAMEFQSAFVYLSVLFFDSDSNLLGHFQGGGVGTVSSVGGGTGSWKTGP